MYVQNIHLLACNSLMFGYSYSKYFFNHNRKWQSLKLLYIYTQANCKKMNRFPYITFFLYLHVLQENEQVFFQTFIFCFYM